MWFPDASWWARGTAVRQAATVVHASECVHVSECVHYLLAHLDTSESQLSALWSKLVEPGAPKFESQVLWRKQEVESPWAFVILSMEWPSRQWLPSCVSAKLRWNAVPTEPVSSRAGTWPRDVLLLQPSWAGKGCLCSTVTTVTLDLPAAVSLVTKVQRLPPVTWETAWLLSGVLLLCGLLGLLSVTSS